MHPNDRGIVVGFGMGVLFMLAVVAIGVGCVAPPGRAVARAYDQTIDTGWTANEKIGEYAFLNRVRGGQEPDVTMYEGILLFAVDPETGKVLKDETGEPYIDPLTSRITAYLRIRSDQGDIGDSFAIAAKEFTKQAQIAAEQFGKAMDLVATMLPMMIGGPTGGGGADDAPPPTGKAGEIVDALAPVLGQTTGN